MPLKKPLQHIRKWKKLKGRDLEPEEINQLKIIFDQQNQLK